MNYEQKYKEASKWVDSIFDELTHEQQMQAEAFFPELKESEDERIRKVLLNDFKNNCSEYYCEGVNRDMIIAWLEKQDKKISADKVIEWMKTHGNLWPRVTIKINEVIDKFKKDFDL